MATVALSTLRSRLRTYIKDSSANQKWTDAEINLFLNHAILQWTTDVPIASSTSYTRVSGQHAYELPENAVSVTSVYGYFESASTPEYLAPMKMKPGAFEVSYEPRRYVVGFPTDTQFYLPREPQADFTLYYGATATWLENDTDLLNLGIKRWGEQAVLYYAAFLAYNPSAAARARLEQWARSKDLNVGNPLQEEGERWLALYHALVAEHAESATYEFVPLERT